MRYYLAFCSKTDFDHFSESGATIIYPDSRARIVMFGYHLDKISIISLTTDNCFNSVVNISRPEFLIQTVKRLDFVAYFAEYVHCLFAHISGSAAYFF